MIYMYMTCPSCESVVLCLVRKSSKKTMCLGAVAYCALLHVLGPQSEACLSWRTVGTYTLALTVTRLGVCVFPYNSYHQLHIHSSASLFIRAVYEHGQKSRAGSRRLTPTRPDPTRDILKTSGPVPIRPVRFRRTPDP